MRHQKVDAEQHGFFLYAFDLLELDGTDLRREPLEVRKATLASILRKSRFGIRLNGHLEHDCGLTVFSTPAGSGARASSPSGWDRATGPAVHPTGPSSRTRRHQPLGARRKRIILAVATVTAAGLLDRLWNAL